MARAAVNGPRPQRGMPVLLRLNDASQRRISSKKGSHLFTARRKCRPSQAAHTRLSRPRLQLVAAAAAAAREAAERVAHRGGAAAARRVVQASVVRVVRARRPAVELDLRVDPRYS